jgi:signal transduction histidine kinase
MASDKLLQLNFEIITIFLEYQDWHKCIERVFDLVGKQVEVDRIYYWDIHIDPISGDELTSQRFEWVKNGIEPMIDNPELQNLPIDIAADFLAPLVLRKPFESIIRELPDGQTKEILQSQDILSILVLPIFLDDKLYGFIGFDDCTCERVWNSTELDFLRSITSNLSSAIQRHISIVKLEEKTAELKVINSELEQFAYVASHDLQEPLRMVTGFLELFEKKYHNLVDVEGKMYIDFAVSGAQKMKSIIKDLLEYARIGRTKESIEEFELSDLLNNVKSLLSVKIAEKQAEIVLKTPITIQSWRSPLNQVIMNLIDNAIKYAKADVTPHIEIEVAEEVHHLHFKVSDNGIGIDEKYFPKIFLIFQRLHSSSEYNGSGVGLSVTKKIIDNLGGKIWLTSTKGVGTCFHFLLPKF